MVVEKKKTIATAVLYAVFLGSVLNGIHYLEQQNQFDYAYQYHQVLTQEQDILKSRVALSNDLADKSKLKLTEKQNELNFIVPHELDTSSMLIFLEEYALLNDVTVSKVDLHKEKENGIFTSLGITYKPISVEAMGDYQNMMRYLSDIQNNMGVVNFIDEIVFQGTTGDLIEWNQPDDSIDNNITVHFKLYIGFSEKEGETVD